MILLKLTKVMGTKEHKNILNQISTTLKSFLEGKSSLNSLEIGLLEDVRDKKILHLQCHFGMDTILYRSEI